MNRRIKKTKNEIKKALLQASISKGLQKVTVQDIIDRADINRATFYYHYKDKIDLVAQIENETLNGLKQTIQLSDNHFNSFEDIVYHPMLATLDHVKKYEDVYNVLLSSNGITNFSWKMLDELKSSLSDNYDLLQKGNIEILHDKSYLVNFIAGAHISVIVDWIKNGLENEPQLLAKQMASILTNGVKIKYT